MDALYLIGFALGYVALQALALLRFEGLWLRAAILSVPLLCALLVSSVSLGLFGIVGAEFGAIIAVPLGATYLAVLIVAHMIVQIIPKSPHAPEEVPNLRTTLSKGQAERQRRSSGWLATAETID